jgi:hypothetical protein
MTHLSSYFSAKGRASKIDKNIDKYIEESKHYVLSKYFKKGFYLDVKDEFNWCVAKIDDATPDNSLLTIYFDNWSTKYNEVCVYPSIQNLMICQLGISTASIH